MTSLTIESISADTLTWPGASQEQLDFLRHVYERHVARARRARSFVADVPDRELAPVEAGHRMRTDAAAAARAMLAAVRDALAAAQAARRPDALAVQSVSVASAYRPASRQLAAWQRNFPRYYAETVSERDRRPGGPHGSAAAELLARYVGARLAAPGYSLHNNGRALDLRAVEGGVRLGPSTAASSIRRWRASWVFAELQRTARGFGFSQNTAIDEPWHWEHRAGALPVEQTRQWRDPAAHGGRGVVPAGRLEVPRVPLLRAHRGTPPDLVLRWNDLPQGGGRVDVVVHLHGYSSRREGMRLPRDKEPHSGLDWSDPTGLDPGRRRGAPSVGILPRGNHFGGRSGGGYDFPALSSAGALAELVRFSLTALAGHLGIPELAPGRLLMTAHSGGGAAVERVLRHNDPDEVHLFDATYGRPAQVLRWARERVTRAPLPPAEQLEPSALRVLYRPDSPTEQHALGLRRALSVPAALAPWYRVEPTRVSHGLIPRRFGWLLLADAGADAVHPGEQEEPWLEHGEGDDEPEEAESAPGRRRRRSTSALRTAWARYRCAEAEMVAVRVLSHRTPVNPVAVAAYAALDRTLRATGYQARSTWAYNCRSIAGTSAYSLHSYGTAVDIDPRENPHRRGTTSPVRFSPAPTRQGRASDVAAGAADTVFTPEQVAAVEAIRTVEGHPVWAWGGRWSTSHDSMHFQVDCTPQELVRGVDPATVATVLGLGEDTHPGAR